MLRMCPCARGQGRLRRNTHIVFRRRPLKSSPATPPTTFRPISTAHLLRRCPAGQPRVCAGGGIGHPGTQLRPDVGPPGRDQTLPGGRRHPRQIDHCRHDGPYSGRGRTGSDGRRRRRAAGGRDGRAFRTRPANGRRGLRISRQFSPPPAASGGHPGNRARSFRLLRFAAGVGAGIRRLRRAGGERPRRPVAGPPRLSGQPPGGDRRELPRGNLRHSRRPRSRRPIGRPEI